MVAENGMDGKHKSIMGNAFKIKRKHFSNQSKMLADAFCV